MSRRIYHINPKSRQIRQEALLAMRAAKKELDPGLLDMARRALVTRANIRHEQQRAGAERADKTSTGSEPIDMKKNMEVVLAYLEITNGNKDLHRRVAALLAQS